MFSFNANNNSLTDKYLYLNVHISEKGTIDKALEKVTLIRIIFDVCT